ncbi:MAG: oligosaccharide flippase family protein [Sedimentisphaerales bacterium]|nr:oligosaccharide flippase family protein [Sedimentisphaerales bacterium]
MAKSNKHIVVNMASGIVRACANIAIFIAITPYIRRQLGNDINGIWWFIGSLMAFLSLAQSFVSNSVAKFVAECKARHEPLHEVFCSAAVLHALICAVSLIPAALFFLFTDIVQLASQEIPLAKVQLALLIMIGAVFLSLLFTIVQAAIEGLQRYVFVNSLAVCVSMIRATAIILLLHRGYGLVNLAWITLICNAVSGIAATIFLFQIESIKLARCHINRGVIQKLMSFGVFSFLSNLANWLLNKSHPAVIGLVLSPVHITIYGIAPRLMQPIQEVCGTVMRIFMPVTSEISVLTGQERKQKFEDLFTRASRFSLIMVLPVILFLMVRGREFIQVWQGEDYHYAKETYYVLVILLASQIPAYAQTIGSQMHVGLAKHGFPAVLGMVMAVINLVLSLVLAKYHGIIGVAWASVIVVLLRRTTMQFYFRSILRISMLKYYWNVCAKLLPFSLIFVVFLIWQQRFLAPVSTINFLVLGLLNAIVFWFFSYWALDRYERRMVRELLGRLLRRQSDN